MASHQQSRKETTSKQEDLGLKEIAKFRAEAQQNSADAIRAAQERYSEANKNLQAGGAATHGTATKGNVTATQAPGVTVVSCQESKNQTSEHEGSAQAEHGQGATTASSRGTEKQHTTKQEGGPWPGGDREAPRREVKNRVVGTGKNETTATTGGGASETTKAKAEGTEEEDTTIVGDVLEAVGATVFGIAKHTKGIVAGEEEIIPVSKGGDAAKMEGRDKSD